MSTTTTMTNDNDDDVDDDNNNYNTNDRDKDHDTVDKDDNSGAGSHSSSKSLGAEVFLMKKSEAKFIHADFIKPKNLAAQLKSRLSILLSSSFMNRTLPQRPRQETSGRPPSPQA